MHTLRLLLLVQIALAELTLDKNQNAFAKLNEQAMSICQSSL
jgi:hypothetical protein